MDRMRNVVRRVMFAISADRRCAHYGAMGVDLLAVVHTGSQGLE